MGLYVCQHIPHMKKYDRVGFQDFRIVRALPEIGDLSADGSLIVREIVQVELAPYSMELGYSYYIIRYETRAIYHYFREEYDFFAIDKRNERV